MVNYSSSLRAYLAALLGFWLLVAACIISRSSLARFGSQSVMEESRMSSFLQRISNTSLSNQLVCPLCPAQPHLQLRYDIKGYLKHIKLLHAHQSGFKITCGISGCKRTFTNFRTFQDHVSATHKHQNQFSDITNTTTSDEHQLTVVHFDSPSTSTDSLLSTDENIYVPSAIPSSEITYDRTTENNLQVIQKSSALFMLGLKEKHKIPQAVLQEILHGVTNLTQIRLNALHSDVMQVANEGGLSLSLCDKLNNIFDENGQYGCPFKDLETQYQQMKYFKTHFRYVEPVQILLGERRVWKGRGIKRRCILKKDYAYYVPILETLQTLLLNEGILTEVQNGHSSSNNILQDFCDGSSFSSNILYATKLDAIQIMLYYDELEVCNPLSSKTNIHKLGNFYFTLGNMHPRHRSQLSAIQLVCIAKTCIIKKYGIDAILKPLVEDIKELEKGRTFVVNKESKVYFGSLALVSADNLGSLALGGFKESCTANRMCRHCMATKEDFRKHFRESHFELRNKESHLRQCALVNTDITGDCSKEYGINRNSILNELTYFDMCNGSLIPDVMHDLLEGTLQYEVKLMLKSMIFTEEYFSLDYLNSRVANLELGHMESKDRPSFISVKTLQSSGCSLKQKAAQMWLFGRILPLLIGEKVPDDDEKWNLFLNLMEIVDYLFSPKIIEDQAAHLSALISDHHQDFVTLYPDHSIIPKMHFMIHMPRLMIQFGPLVHHWTMRFEAKHAYFKKLAQSLGNFINLPYSLSTRHQQLHCYLYSNTKEIPGGNGVEIGPGCVTSILTQEENSESAFEANWIKFGGNEYRPGDGVILSMDVDKDLPNIGVILKVYFIDDKMLFQVRIFNSEYESHYRAYTLQNSPAADVKYVYHSKLALQDPVHIRTFGHKKLFILPHAL